MDETDHGVVKLRPSILYPLFAGLETLSGVGPKTAKSLSGLDVARPRDLLFTLPNSGIDRHRRATIADAELPAIVTVAVEVGRHFAPSSDGRPYRVEVHDARTSFNLVFFRANPESLKKRLPTGVRKIVSGWAELYGDAPQMVHPDHVIPADDSETLPRYEPIYPLCAGLTQRTMAQAVSATLELLPDFEDWIDEGTRRSRGWPEWKDAVRDAHHPNSERDLAPDTPSRERLAYDELFAQQITLALERADLRTGSGVRSAGDGALRAKVLEAIPYQPTKAQTRTIKEIVADMGAGFRMNRLLHGDVGSGKTLVALIALVVAVEAGGQGALMAPTEVLAQQHLAALLPLAKSAGIKLDILTGRDSGAIRTAKLKSLGSGEIDILVGTHALLQPDVEFTDLRLVIVDEQHRFGVDQRDQLAVKGGAVDMLAMSATPIPRSIALAQFGNMDISVLDEMPRHRKRVRTAVAPVPRLDAVVSRLKSAVSEGQRAYWVCPQVQESEATNAATAEERFQTLRIALGEDRVGMVHGQMQAVEKDAAMAAFVDGKTSVLVSTTVIEVGVDVPDASIMVVEQAEMFGLAQLHQLRGRVGRGSNDAACLLLYQPPLSGIGERRLELLRETDDGFRLAEADLLLRGPGDVVGIQQSGSPRFRIADIRSQSELVVLAQSDARRFVEVMRSADSGRIKAVLNLLWLMEQEKMIHLIPES